MIEAVAARTTRVVLEKLTYVHLAFLGC